MKVKILSAVVLLFFVFDAFVGQITIKQISAKTEQTELSGINQMPNLKGDEAKQYLAQQGSDKSLGEAIKEARCGVNWIEYVPVSDGSGAFEARNSQQEFAAYFSNDGVNLVSRHANEQWNLSLKLTGYGRGANQWAVVGGQPIKQKLQLRNK